MHIREFIDSHYHSYNSRELKRAAKAYEAHIQGGGRMFVSMAGAMSTAKIGGILGRAIRADLVHGISCTGANLEEDAYNLVAGHEYEHIEDWRALRAEDEAALLARGMNRVTDTCIPETVMRHVEKQLHRQWKAACDAGISPLPSEHMMAVLADPEVQKHFREPEGSWLLAAAEKGIPVYTPGWEDSTSGNMFAAAIIRGEIPSHTAVAAGTEQMVQLIEWYQTVCSPAPGAPSVGFFQIGGGIAGDFAICAVPCMVQDLEMTEVPHWGYFCQVSDAVTSYGGYSGAVPNEKITWGKLTVETPKFMIESDATIVAPLILAYILGE